jgi:hypothetical protein
MQITVNVGDEIIVYDGKLKRAVVTEMWPSKHHPEEAGVLEIEFDNLMFGKTRKLIDADSIRSVKPRVKEG